MFDLGDYSRKYAEQYEEQSFEILLIKIRRKQVLKSLKKYNHDHILEVGCGLEPLFLHWDDYKTYMIVEPSEDFARNARKAAWGKGSIVVVQGYLEDVYEQLVGHGFDFIILSSLLHEVPNPVKLLQSVYQLCRKSTVVHVNVPNVFSFHRLLALEMGIVDSIYEKSEAEIQFQRHTRFDKESLFRIVEENGFQVLSSGTYFIKPFSNEQMAKIMNNKIADIAVIEGLEKMIKYLPDMGCEMFLEMRRK